MADLKYGVMQRTRHGRRVVLALAWVILAGFLAGSYPVHGFGSPTPWPDDDSGLWHGTPPALTPWIAFPPTDSEADLDRLPPGSTHLLDAGERRAPSSRGPPSHC